MKVIWGFLCFVCLTTVAHADRKAADGCAASLSPQARQIYEATLASNPTPGTARGIVVAQVEKLIGEGKLTMADARAAGEAAGSCLKMLE
jgi:hypothetical protein